MTNLKLVFAALTATAVASPTVAFPILTELTTIPPIPTSLVAIRLQQAVASPIASPILTELTTIPPIPTPLIAARQPQDTRTTQPFDAVRGRAAEENPTPTGPSTRRSALVERAEEGGSPTTMKQPPVTATPRADSNVEGAADRLEAWCDDPASRGGAGCWRREEKDHGHGHPTWKVQPTGKPGYVYTTIP